MRNIKLYIFITVIAVIIFLIINIPASFLVKKIEQSNLPLPAEYRLSDINGTVWKGGGDLRVNQKNLGYFFWDLREPELFTGELNYFAALFARDTEIGGDFSRNFSNYSASNIKGFIGLSLLREIFSDYKVNTVGSFTLENINITLEDNKISEASGDIIWPGADIAYYYNGKENYVYLPKITGKITLEGEDAKLQIHQEDENKFLAEVILKPSGWAVLKLTRSYFDLFSIAKEGSSKADDIVFEIEKSLF